MASNPKKARPSRINKDELELDSDREGMDSGEESEIDRLLLNSSEESSDEEQIDDYDYELPAGPSANSSEEGNASDKASDVDSSDGGDDGNAGRDGPCGGGARARGRGGARARGRGGARACGRGGARACGRGGARARGRGGARVRGRGGARARGRGQAGQNAAAIHSKSYDDPDVGNVLPPFKPSRPTGVHFGRPFLRKTMTTAVEFFHLFFSVDMINNICKHTNSYAIEHISAGTHRSYTKPDGSWQDTTPDEINKLIALLIYFGLVNVGSDVDKYWSTKSLYHGLWARSILSRVRYRALMSLLHVVDPATEAPGDKLREVDSFVNDFKDKCQSLYQPKQEVAIDERMVKSRHRSGIRQYIRDKPTKWGIKLWLLADSSNGYTVDFNVYIGKAAGRDVSANGLGYDVVMKLMQPYCHQGYHLFFDNFYTSVHLVRDLFQLGVPATGTVSENCRGFPQGLKNGKQWAKRKERGCMRWERTPPILALQWIDNKVVSLLTTIDNANESVQVIRKTKTNNVWREVEVPQPKTVDRYNKYMNAVDRSDQILSTNNVMRKCMRWWKALFFHLIDIAVVNSFILFREHSANFPDIEELRRPKKYSLADYREELVRQLCGFDEYDVPPVVTTIRPPQPPVQEFLTVHMPAFSENNRTCVVCYKKGLGQLKVSSYCSAPQCGKYLHVTRSKNCFAEWHSREYHKH